MNKNKRIAQNSLILYARLIVTSIIGLYSSRLVLQELGVEDFGLYGVIGGIVALMNFLNSSMISTSNRFLAVELGKINNKNVNKIFNTILVLHLILALFILVIGEFLGSWYVVNHLNVDRNKIPDALFVLHFSVITAAISTVLVPFQGMLIVHEKFNVKTIFEIVQSLLHLLLIVIISLLNVNKLRTYSFLVLILAFIIFIIHVVYLKYKFSKEIKWSLNRKLIDYREVSVFFGWSIFYVFGASFSKQGASLILNSFFGTVLNAAFSIANRVFQLVYSFVKNLNQAAIPQIMINYSAGKQEQSLNLIYNLSKFTFFIMYIVALPLILSIDSLLELWLDEVPDYSAIFATLMIIHGLISCLESGFDATIDSTGKIKKTKILFNIIMLSTLPILYCLYYFGFPPYTLTVVTIISEIVFLLVQLGILKNLVNLSVKNYIIKTIQPIFIVVLITLPQVFLKNFFDQSLFSVLVFSIISVLLTLITIYIFGLKNHERRMLSLKLSSLKEKYLTRN